MNHETHYSCDEMFKKYKGNPPCCGCEKHECKD